MKTRAIKHTDDVPIQPASADRTTSRSIRLIGLPLAMVAAFILLDAVLPLRGLYFYSSLLNQLSSWTLLPTQLLFPHQALISTLFSSTSIPPTAWLSWKETALLGAVCGLLLLVYLAAIQYLAGSITRRYLLFSTCVLGGICVIFPIITSPDIFSYIIYARMGIIYHLNPLTTLPSQISQDLLYPSIYWKGQPSAYGPTWAIFTCALQWLVSSTGISGTANVACMLLALRLSGLLAHLWSTALIWSIAGRLQHEQGQHSSRLRQQATLAFAWNPLLLFEACVNAHNDTFILLLVLVGIWCIVRNPQPAVRTYAYASIILVLATCLKVNTAILIPGVLLFLWNKPQRIQTISTFLGLYGALFVAFYLPFWQQGALLNVLHVNPTTYRNINTLSEFLTFFYNSLAQRLGAAPAAEIGSPAENFLHTLSMLIFIVCYAYMCWRAYRRQSLRTPLQLIRWLALAWLLYCAVGSPWFWPWYTVTFFGLFALCEAVDTDTWQQHPCAGFLRLPLAVRLLAFSMLSLYCFYTYIPNASVLTWFGDFHLSYLRSLWIWLIPLLAIAVPTNKQNIRATREVL